MNLFESGPIKILFHYTNIESLLDILKSGFLETRKYETGTHDFSHKEEWPRKREIATIRPSMASTQKMEDITMNAGNIRFIIQVHKLLDKQRGIKVRPIAEFPLGAKKGIKKTLKNFLTLNDSEVEKMANKICRNLSNLPFDEKRTSGSLKEIDVLEFLKKELSSYKGKLLYVTLSELDPEKSVFNTSPGARFFFRMKMYFTDFLNWKKKREGEERIIFNKNIPLDPDYLKIELLPKFKLSDNAFFNDRLFDSLDANKNLFIKNYIYKKITTTGRKKIF